MLFNERFQWRWKFSVGFIPFRYRPKRDYTSAYPFW